MYSHNSTFKSKPFKKLAVLASIACLSLTLSTTLWAKKDGDSFQAANIVDFDNPTTEVAGAATLRGLKSQ